MSSSQRVSSESYRSFRNSLSNGQSSSGGMTRNDSFRAPPATNGTTSRSQKGQRAVSMILSKVRAEVWSGSDSSRAGSITGGEDDEFDESFEDDRFRVLLTYSALNEQEALQHVRSAKAGATVLFTGTTRNEFQGKSVERLEYSAYSKMARKMMTKIVNQQSEKVHRIYLAHRLGTVYVEEPSILVCCSSAHRREAFQVCEEILEQVKEKVPIWKRECYLDQTGEWKANERRSANAERNSNKQ